MLNDLLDAADIQFGSTVYQSVGVTVNELHDQRKTLRRAINTIAASTPPGDEDTVTFNGLQHAGSLVAKIDLMLDLARDSAKPSKSAMNVMRTADYFAQHYTARGNSSGEVGVVEFLRGIAGMATTPDVRNALSVGTDTAGGFAVPSRLMPTILAALTPVSSLLRAGAGIVPINDGAKSFTASAVNAIPTAAWRAEAGTLASSDPTFRAVTATPRSLAFPFKVSREFLADAANMEEALQVAIAQRFARELDRVGLLGTGSAPEPRGVRNTFGIQTVTNGANGAALASYANTFSAAQAMLRADAPMPTAATISPRSLIKLGGLIDTTNQRVGNSTA